MGRFPAGKLRLWTGQFVNAPFVTPPISLRIVLVLCILSVTATLAYGVFSQLGHTGAADLPAIALIAVAVVYFVLPVLVATSISTNRPISRPLIVTYNIAVAYQLVSRVGSAIESPDVRSFALVSITLVLIGIMWWLYRSSRIRVYYALISGRPIPDDLSNDVDALTSPGRFESAFGRIGQTVVPYLEIAVFVLIIAALWVGISMTG